MMQTKKDADKGEKEVKLTADQSSTIILDYLRKQNRPYSAIDISTNLNSRVTKAAAAKILEDMHQRNEIEGRAAGKQIVYHAIQEEVDDTALEDLQATDTEIVRLKKETTAFKCKENELRLALRGGASQMPIQQLRASVAALDTESVEKTGRLGELRQGKVKAVSLEDRERVKTDHNKWKKIAENRKSIRTAIWMVIVEQLGGDTSKAEELKEDLGLEF